MNTTVPSIPTKAGLLACLFALLALGGHAQTEYQKFQTKHLDISFRRWTQKEGLPHWQLNGAFKAANGFVYLKNGPYLLRFNGRHFTVLDTLPENFMSPAFFAEDRQQRIWLKWDHHLHLILPEGNQVISYAQLDLAPLPVALHPKLHLFALDQLIHLYDSDNRRLWRLQNQNWQLLLDLGPAPKEAPYLRSFALPEGPEHWWLVQRDTASLYRTGNPKPLEIHTLKGAEDQAFEYYQSKLYQSDSSGKTQALAPWLPPKTFALQYSMWGNTAGELKPSLYQTEYQINLSPSTEQLKLRPQGDEKPIPLDQILGFPLEVSGSLQYYHHQIQEVAPHHYLLPLQKKGGLLELIIRPRTFRTLAPGRSIRSVCLLPDAQIAFTQMSLPLSASLIKPAAPDSCLALINPPYARPYLAFAQHQQLRLASDRGKLIYSASAEAGIRIFYTDSSLTSDEPRGLAYYPDSSFLFAWESQLSLFSRWEEKPRVLKRFGPGQKSRCLSLDRQGQAWLGTESGLYHLATDRFYLSRLKGQKLLISHIYPDPHGFFWLASNKGLLKWRPFEAAPRAVFNRDSGLINEELHAVYPDRLGRLWLSSNGGIICVDTLSGGVRNYTEAEGLYHREHNFMAHQQDHTGRLYMGGLEGLCVFDPQHIPHQDYGKELLTASLWLSQLEARDFSGKIIMRGGKAGLDALQTIALPASTALVILNFDYPYFHPNDLNFFWRIPERGSTWLPFSPTEGLNLTETPRGNFRLEIKLESSAGSEARRLFSYPFYQRPPFYQNPLFYLFAGLLLILTIHLVSRYRSRSLLAQKIALHKEVLNQTQQLQDQNRQIAEKNQKLLKLDQAKGELFRNLSHEFRTPLSIINSEVERLQESLPQHEKEFKTIHRQTEHLNKMLSEILTLSKLQMAQLRIQKDRMLWPDEFQELFYQLEGLAYQKQQSYQLSIHPEQKKMIVVLDRKRFERISTNLVGNALKFSPVQGRVEVRLELRAQSLYLQVKDNGPGILSEEKEAIFKANQRGSAAQAKPGFGIGLALAREYTEFLGGKLSLESEAGLGACFRLELPVSRLEMAPALSTPEPAPKKAPPARPRAHILIVEDHPDLLESLRQNLQALYQISTALHGQQALEILQREASIDLIISDVMMPIMNGYQLLKKLRQDPNLMHKPFLMLSALSDEQDRLQALRLGVDSYVVKPFSLPELKLRLENMLSQQKRRRDFLRHYPPRPAALPPAAKKEEIPSFDELWLQKLESVVEAQLSDSQLKIAHIADLLNVSERSLFNKVKACTGLSPSEYLRKARLRRAQSLLHARRYPTVKEVAYAVGLVDAKNFRTQYKKEFGLSPKEDLG